MASGLKCPKTEGKKSHIFKKGKKADTGNYKPLRLTSVPRRVMGQLVLENISRNMTDNKIIRRRQNAFNEGKSCLINFCDEKTGLGNIVRAVDIVYLDINFRKAFETITNKILIDKLWHTLAGGADNRVD